MIQFHKHEYRSIIRILAITAVLFATISFLTGCSVKDKLLGKWMDESGATIEFLDDGTFISQTAFNSIQGEYSVLKDGRIKMQSHVWGTDKVVIYEVKFDGDTMTFVGANGGTLQRVKK